MSLFLRLKKQLCKFGWYSIDVPTLHWNYLKGYIGQEELYDLLQPAQVDGFIKHHHKLKEEFDRSESLGLTKTDELPEGLQDLINNPLMKTAMHMDGRLAMTSKERQRMIPALNQLDGRIMHKVLEREVMKRHGKANVVMDQSHDN